MKFREWRVLSSETICHNKVGVKITEEQAAEIMPLFETAGFYPRFSDGFIKLSPSGNMTKACNALCDLCLLYGIESVKLEERKKSKEAKEQKELEKLNAETAELKRLNAPVSWIDSIFPEYPPAMGNYNKIALARYLAGETKEFSGGTSRCWIEALEKLGIDREQKISAIVLQIKDKYLNTESVKNEN